MFSINEGSITLYWDVIFYRRKFSNLNIQSEIYARNMAAIAQYLPKNKVSPSWSSFFSFKTVTIQRLSLSLSKT